MIAACNQTKTNAGASSEKITNSYQAKGDHTMGDPKAPITMIEYASFTCAHCAHFHEVVWSDLKEKYIDTGKVYYIFRPFPTPPVELAVTESMIAECSGDKNFFKAVNFFMKRQQAIFSEARQGRAKEALFTIAKGLGLNEKQVDQCIDDETILAKLGNIQEHAIKTYNINATPSFIINGKLAGYVDFTEGIKAFDELFLPFLESEK